jgi:hypothetical protein
MLKPAMTIVAAALCAGAAAQAKTVSVQFNGFCNGLDIMTSKKNTVVELGRKRLCCRVRGRCGRSWCDRRLPRRTVCDR